ncbi:hypothetical protein HZU38_17940 [Mycolicibacterium vanbaalenii]|jgi:hypothetical protein|uniref:hypothetical protein n=1 Tax=Mycolicibacterium vanbaalenii TaxID=110539 RepID=UPI0011AE55D0|nr:hypothetical protein [Mycolicibacterium vanbaalenii]UJL26839.1 hypothetical protein HZU38_17940 [Mycolicibacterium vanbaalenii]WND58960.1 hypothetical protein QQA43_11545 [Mycolicibacterium vanbaalenii]
MSIRVDLSGSADVEDGGVQSVESTREVRPDPGYHRDRPSARTEEERLEHFEHWYAKRGAPYAAAVREAGAEPWTDSMDERRELWMRRYTRPAPPANLRTMPGIPRSHAPEITQTTKRTAAA